MTKDLFLSNRSDTKFIIKLRESLENCESFCWSVSFIKLAGLKLIKQELEEALDRGVKGKIITSTYQNFTDIPSLDIFEEWQKKYPNFQCHLDHESFGDNGFHSKGYLFEYKDHFEFIVGSTNITRFALLKNIEWNVSLCNLEKTDSIKDAYAEFYDLWNETNSLNKELINEYKMLLEYAIEKWDMDYIDPTKMEIVPNAMQKRALKEIKRYRDMGSNKALVISATGSGKTFLAAFDARNFSPQKLLFIVHRDTILNDAMNTFMKVFGASKSYGIYSGDKKELDREFVFASTRMLSMHLDEFDKQEFDYIVYDEVHHMAAEGGLKIFEYFEPEFLLGLTATPDRMDKKDVYGLFDNNVPFDLRLKDAITYDLVVPFHYYGIKTNFADYSSKDKNVIAKEIASPENVEFINTQIEKYRIKNEKLKAIAFCTSLDHCYAMASEFKKYGYHAVALTGQNDTGERIKAFNDLQNDEKDLEIICAIDILNEGVDIPAVNMVLFLRPTDSEIVFIQQLGRGLRKYPNKEYVTVLDFIGNNYDRAVQIVKALGELGDTSYMEKSYLRDLINSRFNNISIPGVVIDFDELALQEILKALDKCDFNKKEIIKKDYENFKKYLNIETYPKFEDFLNADVAPDLIRFLRADLQGKDDKNKTKSHSYYSFLKKIEEEGLPDFNKEETIFLNSIEDMLPITRQEEMLTLKTLLSNRNDFDENTIIREYDIPDTDTKKSKYAIEYLREKRIIDANCKFTLNVTDEMKAYLLDMIDYSLVRHENEYGQNTFKLYCNYMKEQIAIHLGEMVKGPIGKRKFSFSDLGTWYTDTNDTYIFVGLNKGTIKEQSSNFADGFSDSKNFRWETTKNVTFESEEYTKLAKTERVHLFVRKMDKEDGITLPFTYFGTGKFYNYRKSSVYDQKKNKNFDTLKIDIVLDEEVPENMWMDFEIPRKYEEI